MGSKRSPRVCAVGLSTANIRPYWRCGNLSDVSHRDSYANLSSSEHRRDVPLRRHSSAGCLYTLSCRSYYLPKEFFILLRRDALDYCQVVISFTSLARKKLDFVPTLAPADSDNALIEPQVAHVIRRYMD